MELSSGPASRYFRCGSCNKTFKRPEHLKRHEKMHSSGKPHVCRTCSKSFARSDVLLRHEFVHNPGRDIGSDEPRQTRACIPCSRARDRCSRGIPCERCRLRSIKCTYLPTAEAETHGETIATEAPSRSDGGRSEQPRDGSPSFIDDTIAAGQGDSGVPSLAVEPSGPARPSGPSATSPNHSGNNTGGIPTTPFNPDIASPAASASLPGESLLFNYQPRQVPYYCPNPMVNPGVFGQATSGIAFSASDVGPGMNWLPISDDWTINATSILDLSLTPDQAPSDATNTQQLLPSPVANSNILSDVDIALNRRPTGWSPTESSTTSGLSSSTFSNRIGQSTSRGRLYATSSSARTTAYERDRSPPQPCIQGAQPQLPISKLAGCKSQQISGKNGPDSTLHIHNLAPSSAFGAASSRATWYSLHCKMSSNFDAFNLDRQEAEQTSVSREYFPNMGQIESFVSLFYSRFLPSLPIFHQTLSIPNQSWILTLAMAVIGCQFTKTEACSSLAESLHCFLSWVLQREANNQNFGATHISYIQAHLLSQIGLLYYGPQELRCRGMVHRGGLIYHAERLGLFSSDPSRGHPTTELSGQIQTAADQWHRWVEKETARRLGYAIWMLDVMTSYHFNASPLMPAQLPLAQLPHDGLWTATDERQWAQILGRTEDNPPLSLALRRLFLDNQTKSDLGEFGRIILLHGIFHEVYQVKVYAQRPLSTWVPVAQQGATRAEAPINLQDKYDGSSSRWLGETESYASWRNAALDCVDVLHWWANGMIALQSGVEHMTVLHLHFSRIVLLVPLKEITLLVESLTSGRAKTTRQTATEELQKAEQEVIRWAHRDESKSRLATIHCGCVFWHLRRFPAMAFYEVQSIYLATLSLWAYSYYVSKVVLEGERSQQGNSDDAGSESEPDPSFIWIDRPNDDEMVQFFVRTGRPDAIKAFVSGVGDIHESQSPGKILKEGLKVIDQVAFPWGRDVGYANTLRIASEIMSSAKE